MLTDLQVQHALETKLGSALPLRNKTDDGWRIFFNVGDVELCIEGSTLTVSMYLQSCVELGKETVRRTDEDSLLFDVCSVLHKYSDALSNAGHVLYKAKLDAEPMHYAYTISQTTPCDANG